MQPDEILIRLLESWGVAGGVVTIVMLAFFVMAWIESGRQIFRGARGGLRFVRQLHSGLLGRSFYRWCILVVLCVAPVVWQGAVVFLSAALAAYLSAELLGSDRSAQALDRAYREGPAFETLGGLLGEPITRGYTCVLLVVLAASYVFAAVDPNSRKAGFVTGVALFASGLLALPFIPLLALGVLVLAVFLLVLLLSGVTAVFGGDAGNPLDDADVVGPYSIFMLIILFYLLAIAVAFLLPTLSVHFGARMFGVRHGADGSAGDPLASRLELLDRRVRGDSRRE